MRENATLKHLARRVKALRDIIIIIIKLLTSTAKTANTQPRTFQNKVPCLSQITLLAMRWLLASLIIHS